MGALFNPDVVPFEKMRSTTCLILLGEAGIGKSRTLRSLRETAPQANTGPDVPLIRSKSGKRLGGRQIQLNFARWLKQVGITRPFSVHSCRHTFATRLCQKTGDLYLVQRALGHRQITTTEIYARVSDQSLRHAVCLT
jgi:integrase/recombinase XerC